MSRETNFQIQYFPIEKRQEFKDRAHHNNLSMKDLLLLLIKNKNKIEKILNGS